MGDYKTKIRQRREEEELQYCTFHPDTHAARASGSVEGTVSDSEVEYDQVVEYMEGDEDTQGALEPPSHARRTSMYDKRGSPEAAHAEHRVDQLDSQDGISEDKDGGDMYSGSEGSDEELDELDDEEMF